MTPEWLLKLLALPCMVVWAIVVAVLVLWDAIALGNESNDEDEDKD